ncbi:MAG: hypothetical protein R2708_27805 [Vicinamibacterales bacterium]
MNATAHYVIAHVYPVAAALMPPKMDDPRAWRQITAIGLQESEFAARRQIVRTRDGRLVDGPARSFWQGEITGGLILVLSHEATRAAAADVCRVLGYAPTPEVVYAAIEHHDVLAACLARLLLWTDPRPLPRADQAADGWLQYLACWRPGAPHPQTWAAYYAAAWAADWPGTVRA